uniref:Dystroglycan-type cadherin-like domain-containing protein n=1 Tax=viral metagenome TaxID=1070528 RepID=A0A6C0CKG4_9ZZZZ
MNETLSTPIANTLVIGADPILSYSITPALPKGLTLNTTTGNITGKPTVSSANVEYTITATNGITSNTSIVNLEVLEPVNKESDLVPSVPVPNISIPETVFTFPLGSNDATSTPENTGGVITKFTVDPENITQLTGLAFDNTTGVLSGVASQSTILNVSITASNASGQSVLKFTLITGRNIEYAHSAIQGIVGKPIQTIPVSVSNGSGVIITFTSTLTIDSITGNISGIPTSSGKSTVIVTAKTPDDTVFASTQVTLDIQPTEELKNKLAYLAAGSAVAGIGVAALGVAGYLTYAIA